MAVFNLTDIRRMQACTGGEGGLGEPHLLPRLAERGAKIREQRGPVVSQHDGHVVLGHPRLPRRARGVRAATCRRSERRAGVHVGEQAGGWNLQRPRQAEQQQDGNIMPAALNLAQVPVIKEASAGCERLLGQVALLAIRSERRP